MVVDIFNLLIGTVAILFAMEGAKLIVFAPWISSLCIGIALVGLIIKFIHLTMQFFNHNEERRNLLLLQRHDLLSHSNHPATFFHGFTLPLNPLIADHVEQQISYFTLRYHTQHDAAWLFTAALNHIKTLSPDDTDSLAHYMHTVVAPCKIHGRRVGQPPASLIHIHWLRVSNDPNLLLKHYAKMRQESAIFLNQINHLLKHPGVLNQALTRQPLPNMSTHLPATHCAQHNFFLNHLNALYNTATEIHNENKRNTSATTIAQHYKRIRNRRTAAATTIAQRYRRMRNQRITAIDQGNAAAMTANHPHNESKTRRILSTLSLFVPSLLISLQKSSMQR